MTFTDDDLKRLKELNAKLDLDEEISENAALWILNSQPALLVRLEAAEAIVLVNDCECRLDHHGNCQNHFLTNPCEYEAWRKACGRF